MCRFCASGFFALLTLFTLLGVRFVHAEPSQTGFGEAPWMPSIGVYGSYRQESTLSPMSPGYYFGEAVAMTSGPDDMGTHWAVVGAPDDAYGGSAYIFSLAAGATEWHQELRLQNPTREERDRFGNAVAIDTASIGSGIIAVGVPFATPNGAVYIYTRSTDGSWEKTASISPPIGAVTFGASVLLAGNAFLAVGDPSSHGGRVVTYTRSGTTWSQQAIITPPDPADDTFFGTSLSYNAFRLLIGQPYDNKGSAYIFTYRPTSGSWLFSKKLTSSDTSGYDFGQSVALAGATAFVGHPGAHSTGAVSWFTYDSSSNNWTEQPELLPSDSAADRFGESIAVNGLGTNLLVSSSGSATNAYLYSNSGGSWVEAAKFNASNDTGYRSVALADNLALVGSMDAALDIPNRGVVWAFTLAGNALPLLRAITDDTYYDFASSVAISGGTALVWAPQQVNVLGDIGTANIYVRDAQDQWQWQAGLPRDAAPGSEQELRCLTQVAIDGNTAAIGEPGKAVGTHLGQGVVSIYTRADSAWTLQAQLYDPSGKANDLFGCSVAISGNTVIAGSPGLDGGTGGGYVAVRTGDTWSAPTKLRANDGVSGDYLGSTCTVAAHTVVLASWRKDSQAGAAYVFTDSGSAWLQSQKLTTTGTFPINFGFAASLARDGRTLAISAQSSTYLSDRSGSVLIYGYDGRTWTPQQTLNSPLLTSGRFGAAISIDRNTLVVGEPSNNLTHIFQREGSMWSETATLDDSFNSGGFGWSVSNSNGDVIVGAPSDLVSGRGYIFRNTDEIFADGFD